MLLGKRHVLLAFPKIIFEPHSRCIVLLGLKILDCLLARGKVPRKKPQNNKVTWLHQVVSEVGGVGRGAGQPQAKGGGLNLVSSVRSLETHIQDYPN